MTLTMRYTFSALLALLLVSVGGCADTIQFQDPCPPFGLLKGEVVENGKVGDLPFTRVSVRTRNDGSPKDLQYTITQYKGSSRVTPFGFYCPQG